MIDWRVKENKAFETSLPPVGLGPEERLLVQAVRATLVPTGDPRKVLYEACGERAGAAAGYALEGLLHTLRFSARRPVSFRPTASCLGVGEQLVLDLVAASQAQHATWIAALFRWLFPFGQSRAARAHLSLLASALASAGFFFSPVLPLRPKARLGSNAERAVVP